MGLQIQFVDRTAKPPREVQRFQLRTDEHEDAVWVAPEALLLPVKDLPLMTRIEVRVTGTPGWVAGRLQSALFSKEYATPERLPEPRSLGSWRIRDAGVLPAQTACELRVTVTYFDADARGRPTGAEKTETATCQLFTGPPADRKPELSLSNRELTLLGETPVPVTAEVRHARADAPTLSLRCPETVAAPEDPALAKVRPFVPDLKKALEAALGQPPARSSSGELAEFRWSLSVRLSQPAREAVADAGGLTVPLLAGVKDGNVVSWSVRIEAASKVFPGWAVIDFGTTNSTVTVFDNWDHAPPVGLPHEQQAHLQKSFLEWIGKAAAVEAFGPAGRGFDADWERLRSQAAAALVEPPAASLAEWVRLDAGKRLYLALKGIEGNVRSASPEFKRVAFHKLHSLYREALLVPPLRMFRLFPMALDPDTRQPSVASEIEILGVAKKQGGNWPEIRMGRSAQRTRLEALGKSGEANIKAVLERFHPSPKRYFGTGQGDLKVSFDGQQESITVDQLMRAGWEKLLAFAEKAKQEEPNFSEGPLRKAVITYPTVAPPSVRQTIQNLLRDLKIADVRTDYDEAVASAIFYFMREYSGYPELGLESFKARARACRQGVWAQNLLVFDIGGGTTDLALIRLTLTEEAVFDPGEDRGAGGRYYKITPELLSSSGHMQLGGELMTLRIFKLLKGMIADRLLQLVQDGRLTCDPIKVVLTTGLPESAVANGRYRPGWIREVIETESPDLAGPQLRAALALAERVLPTRWGEGGEGSAARVQTFYTLWGFAEEAKIKLGTKPAEGVRREEVFKLDDVMITDLLNLIYPTYHSREPKKDFEVRLSGEKMEQAIGKVVDEAVLIAQGALERLPAGERVDWLILSGQSCNLALVDRKIRESFSASDRFIWNPERVTFLPDYAKLSTSIGACYAENQRRNRFLPKGSKKDLRRGINILYFDVNNLFYYLPCSFVIPVEGGPRPVFEAGQELFDLQGLDDEALQKGQARSGWMEGTALNIDVLRQDYKKGTQRRWGNFDGAALARELELSDNQWREHIQVEFEIDHRQWIDVLLFRKGKNAPRAHICVGDDKKEFKHDLTAEMPKAAQRLAQARQKPGQPAAPGEPPPAVPPLFDDQKGLGWTLAVGGGSPPSGAAPGKVVFEELQKAETVAHDPAGGVSAVLRSKVALEADDFLENDGNKAWVWGRPAGATTWVPLGWLERPGDKPTFRRLYRLTLDGKGVLRLHSGEPPYWESADPRCLVTEPGRVYRRALEATKRETDEERNPFTGKH